MYEALAQLLVDDFGIDAERVRPDATLRDLDLDSLALAELAVDVTEKTGHQVMDVEPEWTLGELARRFAAPVTQP